MTQEWTEKEGACNDHANIPTVDFTKMRKRKASTRTPFVVKQRKDMVTDLEKCCMTM